MPVGDVVEVTAAIEFAVVDDRLHFTVTSGGTKRTYAISFNRARNASMVCAALLDQRDRNGKPSGNVREIRGRRPKSG